jgi:serine/threonine-protein kinase RsbW
MHLSVAVELPAQMWTLAVSRRVVGEMLEQAAVSATIQDDLAVAVTEACSNVVRHAPSSGIYRLTVDVDDDRCVIGIRDAGPGFDPNLPRSTSADRDGGRGLLLMRALVDDIRFENRRPGMTVTMIKSLPQRVDGVTVPWRT